LHESYNNCNKWGRSSMKKDVVNKNYVVLGCGKTAMDTVVYLLKDMKVKPDKVSWVIPNDVWMLRREDAGGPWIYPRALIATGGDREKACSSLEAQGGLVRLDKEVTPSKFKFPVIGKDELEYMRRVPNIIRKGRVTSISKEEGVIKVRFDGGRKEGHKASAETWVLSPSPPDSDNPVFIHCTSPGPFNDNEVDEIFVSDKKIDLYPIYAPPISISLSVLAKLESSRRLGKLDVDFGNKLLRSGSILQNGDIASGEDVLRHLIRGFKFEGSVPDQLGSTTTLAVFFALIDKDPIVGYEWMKQNRLSFFYIPGFKSGIVDDLSTLIQDGWKLGLSESAVKMLELLHEKLQPLKEM